MKISISVQALRKATPDEKKLLRSRFSEGWEFDRIIDGRKEFQPTHKIQFSLKSFKKEELAILWSIVNKYDGDANVLNTIRYWKEAVLNPMNAKVPSLTGLYVMLRDVLKETKYLWVMRKSEEGYMLPYLISNLTHTPRRKDYPEHVSLSLQFGEYCNMQDYVDEDKGQTNNESITFYFEDLFSTERNVISDNLDIDHSNMYDLSALDDGAGETDDDDDDLDEEERDARAKAKVRSKKKPQTKRGRDNQLDLLQILANENVFLPGDDDMQQFMEDSTKAFVTADMIGKVFTSSTKGYMYDGWRDSIAKMEEEGVAYKLVIDMKGIPKDLNRQTSTNFGGMRLIPYHPYLRLYNLQKHCYCSVHARSLMPYKFNKNILDNVSMEDKLRSYLDSLIGGHHVFTDIVAGKSGGMIILSSGEPGLGKTLTAETYSERMELALYQIQSSQLGVEIEKIEENLVACLRRAERWSAVLLIDECDTYVREREKDIVQNCIVGVWLRLLEYFNGIMFLTTNQHNIIDKALLSRCTAHIKFDYPDAGRRKEIIKIHCRLQGITVTEAVAKSIADKITMSGRDIRNLLKNIKKIHGGEDGSKKVSLTEKMVNDIKDYIPFLKEIEKK